MKVITLGNFYALKNYYAMAKRRVEELSSGVGYVVKVNAKGQDNRIGEELEMDMVVKGKPHDQKGVIVQKRDL